MTAVSDFLDAYDMFSSMSEVKIETAIRQAAMLCPPEIWGDNRTDGIHILTAHILSMYLEQIGAITASSVQNAKGTRSTLRMGNDDWLCATVFGQQFKELRDSIPVTGVVV